LEGVARATEALKSTRTEFENQVKTSEADNAKKTASQVDDAVKKALDAKETERRNLDMAKAKHEESLAQESEDSQRTEKELQEVASYLDSLGKDCDKKTVNTYQQADRRKKEQVQALNDAVKVLNGEDVTLSGEEAVAAEEQQASAVDLSKLSPMERAAAEMGVSMS